MNVPPPALPPPNERAMQGYPMTISVNGEVFLFAAMDPSYVRDIMKDICRWGLNQANFPESCSDIECDIRRIKNPLKNKEVF